MKNKKFTSKNLAYQIFKNPEHFEKILESKELKNLLPNILKILKLKYKNQEEYEKVKIESSTELSNENLENLKNKLNLKDKTIQININKNITAGFKATYKDISLDATFETMFKKLLDTSPNLSL